MGTNIAIGNLIGKHNTDTQKINFPFSNSLVDYWNFGGKSNFDKDRTTVTGLLGNVLTAYNFGWSLGSGYGLYKENYLTYKAFNTGSDIRAIFTNTDSKIHVTEINKSNVKFFDSLEHTTTDYSVKVSGLTDDIDLYFNGLKSTNGAVNTKLVNGINYLAAVDKYGGFKTSTFTGKCDVTIEQIPEYEGAIVTDGIDDYLKLDKVGYKVGTVIIKYIPIPTVNRWQYVLDTQTERIFIGYTSKTSVENDKVVSSFTNIKDIGGYKVFKEGGIKNVSTPLFIGSNTNISEPLSMALYSIAIYDRVLSDQEVQEVINFMNKENES